jgi:hypothetical protein
MIHVDHDGGDEHHDPTNDPVNGFHLIWASRHDLLVTRSSVNPSLGVVVRCGQDVPVHWAVNVVAIVGCPYCLELAESPGRMQ